MSKLRALVPYALLLGTLPFTADHAAARIQAASVGMPSTYDNGDSDCWKWTNETIPKRVGVSNNCRDDMWWSMALVWDQPAIVGAKTVKVTAHRDSNNGLECYAVTFASTGQILSEVVFPAFAATGRSTRQININSVPAGAITNVECRVPTGGNTRLFSVEYTP